jgi:Gluconate 2-dehydrogenase subunit 3
MTSRRSFLHSSGGLITGAWVASQWPGIAAAHEHADLAAATATPAALEYLSAEEAATVDAISAQIVPSGATPGAREAHALYFIDRSLATFFSPWAAQCREGLASFEAQFRAAQPEVASFAQASSAQQIAFMRSVDSTEFFGHMRFLTLLGMFVSPKYGGNYQGIGWKLIGFRDEHIFMPPFGDYDRDYTGFVPYPQKST